MDLFIQRDYQVRQTPGNLIVMGFGRVVMHLCSLELPYLNNKKKVSCIIAGNYECERVYNHPTFGDCFLVKNVPGRSGIYIHIGNFAAGVKVDITGCIMVGLKFTDINKDGFIDVEDSTKAMNALRAILPNTFNLIIK